MARAGEAVGRTWHSDHEPVEVGGATLDAMVRATAARVPHRPALVDGSSGGGVTYAELVRRADRVAALLAERGLGPGDVLAVWLPNLPVWAGVTLGALRAGVAVTGVSPAATVPRARSSSSRTRARSSSSTLPAMAPRVRAPHVLAVGDDLLAARGPVPTETAELALLPYSSGTTGLPKGVVISHRALSTAVRQFQAGLRLTERDTLVAVAPFAHVMGFVPNLAVPLAAGATVVTLPRFDPARYFELAGAPPRDRADRRAAPHARAARGPRPPARRADRVRRRAARPPSSSARVARRFPHAAVGQGWGLTETTCGATMPDRERGTAPGSVGRPMPNTELRVVDGELLVRGPQLMTGYLGRPEATAEILDADGWLHTGDVGHIDDGDVFVVDRLKELIKVSGYSGRAGRARGRARSATRPSPTPR